MLLHCETAVHALRYRTPARSLNLDMPLAYARQVFVPVQVLDSLRAGRQDADSARLFGELDLPFHVQVADRAPDVFRVPVLDPLDQFIDARVWDGRRD